MDAELSESSSGSMAEPLLEPNTADILRELEMADILLKDCLSTFGLRSRQEHFSLASRCPSAL